MPLHVQAVRWDSLCASLEIVPARPGVVWERSRLIYRRFGLVRLLVGVPELCSVDVVISDDFGARLSGLHDR